VHCHRNCAINTYDEFGNPAGANSGRYGYTGQAWLPSVTLWYYKARAYEPQLGRFLQPDPADYSQSPNLYAYVLNDPINLVDPFGLQACGTTVGTVCPPPDPGDIVVTGQRLTIVWWPRTSMLIIDRAFNFGGEGSFGGLINQIGKEVHSAVCSAIPHPSGTKMVSVSESFDLFRASLSYGAGVAIDPQSKVALPVFGFLGKGAGAVESVTVNYTTSNAQNFTEFGGIFGEGSALGGIGLGGGKAKFAGKGGVRGTTYSAGLVAGLAVSAGASYTDIGPTINLDKLAGC
jgi:RHS repeat-associated protein